MFDAIVYTLDILLIGLAYGLVGVVLIWAIVQIDFRLWKARRRRRFWSDYYSSADLKKRLTPKGTSRRK